MDTIILYLEVSHYSGQILCLFGVLSSRARMIVSLAALMHYSLGFIKVKYRAFESHKFEA